MKDGRAEWKMGVGGRRRRGRDVERGPRDEAALGIQGRFPGSGQSVKLLESCRDSRPSAKTASAAAQSRRGREIRGSGF